jgi:hypothetical protein
MISHTKVHSNEQLICPCKIILNRRGGNAIANKLSAIKNFTLGQILGGIEQSTVFLK